ncbi:MAG TPA: class I SAM-dependent methyltransferase [Roseiflexaceae bacterium]|nr:class I SAM-dependent methyltransferase [Roseiflexaceae bacterium]
MSLLRRAAPAARTLAALLVKRGLAALLWLAWRSGLNSFAPRHGDTPGRYYIDTFLARYAAECRGVFLEFGDTRYRDRFDRQAITRYDVLDITPRPAVTIVGDIQRCPQIPDATYDVIVCTQVLEHVPNPFLAAAELCRILKPGGRLLLTVPAAFPYHPAPGDYWRFSRDSLRLLFEERLGEIHIETFGNRLTVVGAYWHWMCHHIPPAALDAPDPHNPYIVALYGRKTI